MQCLQSLLEKKVPLVPYARLGGIEGLRLTRAAFSSIIKFSNLADSLSDMIDEVDMQSEELEGDSERLYKLCETVKKGRNFEAIFKRWEQASKMR